MEKPLQITIRGMEHSAALDAHIREKALKLEQFYPRMTDCHVMVEQPHRHHQQGSSSMSESTSIFPVAPKSS